MWRVAKLIIKRKSKEEEGKTMSAHMYKTPRIVDDDDNRFASDRETRVEKNFLAIKYYT